MKHLFTLSEWSKDKWVSFATFATFASAIFCKLVKLVNLVMQFLKLTKLTKLTEQIFAESLKSLKSLMQFFAESAESAKSARSIFANYGVKDVRVSLGQQRTNIQRISNLYLTPNRFFTRLAAVFALVFVLGVGNVWGTEEVIYTLTPVAGSDNSYAGSEDIDCEDEDNDVTITWNVTGNATMTPWRIGGKSLSNTVRVIYSKTAISNNVTKVIVSHGAASNITANVTLNVYSTAAAAAAGGTTNRISSVSGGTVSANGTKTFTRPDGHDWGGRYYRFEYSCTVSGNSNKFLGFSQAEFYAEASSCEKIGTPTVTATPGDRQIVLEWPNQAEASSYTVTCPGGTVGTITGTTTKSCTITSLTNGTSYTWTVTPVGDGSTYCESGNTAASASATPNVYYTVTWNNHGSTSTSSVVSGNKPTFPATPSSCDLTCTTFYGWSTSAWSGSITSLAGKTIYTKASDMPDVSGDVTYYAVYSDGLTTEYTFTSSSWNATSGGSDANWTSGQAGAGYTAGQGVQVTTASTGANATSPISFSNVNKVVVTYNTNKTAGVGSIGIKIGSNSEVTNDVAYDSEISDDGRSANFTTEYTFSPVQTGTIKLTANTTTNSIWPKSIAIYSGAAAPHYLTNCCEALAQINGSVSESMQRSLTLEWDKLSGVDGTTPYTITCKQGSSDAGTIGDIDLSGEKATCTVTGLDCSTTYTFTITAHGDASHCDRTQENIQGTTAGAYVAPALNYSSTALTVGGSTASPSWATTPTHTGTLSYASSNQAVITVNSSTGVVTPVGAGTAHVIASWAQSADYCAATKNSVDITVTGNVSVSFNANGGSGTMTNQSIQVNTPTELKENEFTVPSSCQYFYGWATNKENADAGTRAYENGQSVTINAGMELFAIWKTYNYSVTEGTNEGAATFTLPANVDCGGTISITCAADGTHKGNPTITATEGKYSAINVLSATSAEITGVSGNITVNISYAAKENYSITWKVNGEALTGSALDGVTTKVLEGGSITNLPAAPAGLDCAASFMGWSADEIGLTPLDKDDDAARIAALGLFKNAANAPAIAANTTFHAVFATQTQAGSNSLTKMGAGDNLANNDEIVIVANEIKYALYQEDDGSNFMKYWEFEGDNPTLSDLDDVKKSWIVASSNGKWKLGDATNGYLYNSSSTNISCPTDNYSEWSLTDNKDGTFNLTATQKLSCRSDLNTSNQYKWRGAGTGGNSGTPALLIYKKVSTPAVYNNYVTKCCKPWDNPTVAYGSYNLVAGGDHASITITGDQKGLTPTYTSSNTEVLTVATNGEVTPVGAGKATITVTWASENDYCEKAITTSEFTVTGIVAITFKLNGGSVAEDAEKTQDVTTGEDATLTSIATLGYVAPACKEFGGWAASEEDANAATPVVFKADGATINVSEATTLWAIWNTKTLSVAQGTGTAVGCEGGAFTFASSVACGGDVTITSSPDATHKAPFSITVLPADAYEKIDGNVIKNVTKPITSISVSYTEKSSYAITWKVNGEALTGDAIASSTNLVYEGDAIENLPANPSGLACKNTFKGWSTKDSKTIPQTTAYYDDLFTAASGAPAISEATTFYAVFGSASAPSTDLFSWEGGSSADLTAEGNHVTANGLGSDYSANNHNPYLVKLDGTGDYIIIDVASRPAKVAIGVKMIGGNTTSSITVQEAASKDALTFTDVETLSISGSQDHVVNLETTNPFAATTRAIKLYFTKGSNVGVGPISITGVEVPDYVTECPAVVAPTFDIAAGTYNVAQTVKISNYNSDYMYFYTTDNSAPAADANLDPTGTSAVYDNVTGIAINGSCTLKAVAYNEDVVASDINSAAYVLQVATPTISGNTSFVNSATVTILATGADAIYYTDDDSDPASSGTKKTYSAPFEVSETTTIKAIAVKANWTSSEIASQAFTKITPKTVAEANTAIAALSANGTIANQYVKGLISQIDKFNEDNTITYYISDNGTTASQLQVYHGSAGVANNGNAFTAKENLQLGEEVIVSGTLKKFEKSTNNYVYEFDKPNSIVAYKTHSPIAWSANAYTAELGGSENEFPTLSGTTGLTISYSSSDETVATISADGTTYDLKKTGETTITATSAATDDFVATTKSYTLTVSPTVIRVDLDIDCNGATSGCPETTHLVKQTSLPNPLPEVTKTGKNFGGWYTDNTFETPAVAGAALTENTTIYAQWLEPYTVAQALTMIDALDDNGTTGNVYVAGVVTSDNVSVSSNTATYYIKDASVDNRLEVYKGKGLNNADVTVGDIQGGDQLVVYGQLMKYKGYSETAKPEIVNPNYIYSKVRPTYDVTGVTVASTANVRAGKTITLTATIEPANATDKAVTWSSDAEGVATVDENGEVTGVAEGTAHITVTTHDGGFQATCTVTVAGALPTFTDDDHEWIKISNASKLVAGRFYVIGESSKGVTATNDLSDGYLAKASTTITDGVIASGTLGINTAIFELGGNSTDGWTLYELTDEENTGYLSGTTSSSLAWSESATTTPISFDEDGNAVLGNGSEYRVLYNNSNPRFKPYSGAQTSMSVPQLYMWAELSHSVTFDANGGVAESVPGVERTDEGKIIIPATTPTHSDISKAFGGWYKSDAPATLYNAGDEFETNVDVTLYAKWNTVPTYTVTYVPGGAGTVPAVASYREGQKVQVEEASLSNPGYSFAGWTVKDADQNVLPLDEENKFDMPASNVTITAVWSRISNQKWNLVKQGDALEIDAEYVIAYYKNDTKKALGAISSNIGTAINVTIDDEILKGSDAMKVLTLKAGDGGENYAFQSGSKYLTWSSGNTLNESETLNDASSWTIEIDENNEVDITNVGTTTRYLQYNAGSPRFACYTNTQQKVRLYKKAASVVINGEQTVNAAAITANADVTIKNGGTLNVDADKRIGDLTVEAGGKVELAANKLTVVGTFSIETTMAGGNSGQLEGATASNFEAREAYIDITLGASGTNLQWHAFTVPFPVDVMNGIYDLDGKKLANEVNYAIMDYHGNIRATGAYGWKKIRTTLVPGTFYIMATDGYRTTYRFKKTANGAIVADGSKTFYEYAASGEGESTDAGWNGIGNPTLMYGKVNAEVQVLDPVSYTYIKKDANSTNFVVGTPFFYQAAGNGSISMLTADAGASYAPARTPAKGIEKIKVAFGNEEFTDYLDISASEEALNEYQIGKDLVKMTMTNTPKVAQIFGKAYNTKLCMVHAPMVNDQAEVALELYAPQAGTYTISVPAEREDASLYLTKDGNIIWDLTVSPYEAEFDKGQNNGYGLMLVRKAPQVTTGVENVQDDKTQCTKVILNDHVYILRDAQLYDVTGKAVK